MRGLVMGLMLVVCAPAIAQQSEAERTQAAKQHYESGMAAYHLDDWDGAIAEWEAGFRVKPVPEFLYNIAQAYRLSKRLDKAVAFYRKYLVLDPRAPNRAEVERHIRDLNAQLEQQKPVPVPVPVPVPAPTATLAPAPAPAAAVTVTHKRAPRKALVWGLVGGAVAVAAAAVIIGVLVGTSSGDDATTLPAVRF